ncbi:MAG: LON peptidase substrate-binding domain-containing protein [Dehalococcoidia bacterium]|nr:LON peptidase substrate-binding domain-containing protein [Dehalococcoidia bacterium]
MAQPHEESPDGLTRLALFPLNLVLFPGMELPLHIFEERYKDMIGECLEQDVPFGVVLIKEGLEVGAPADPERIGTSTRILRSEILDQGRMNIVTKGERRFEIEEIIQRVPHVVGRVRFLVELEGEGCAELIPQINDEYVNLVKNLTALTGGYTSRVEIPEDPIELSYAIAGNLNLEPHLRQSLLVTETAATRLFDLVPLLKQGNETLREQITKQNPFQGNRLN